MGGMKIIYAPNPIPENADTDYTLFLAGSIEMGTAEEWQTKVELYLADRNVLIFNPRRQDWDSSWEQRIENDKFREQVEWELEALEEADKILIYFDPKTKSPISLLELGLHAQSGKVIVCCAEGFWKKGNVDIVCKRYKISQIKHLTEIRDIL